MQRIPLISLTDDEISRAIVTAGNSVEYGSFELGVSSSDEAKKAEGRKKFTGFVSSLGKKHSSDNFDLYILVNLDRGFIDLAPSPVYVKGFYNKYSRLVAQTFHYCFRCKGSGCSFCKGTGKLSEHSVQELCEKVFLPAFGAKESKFHGCGREDVDVLMLGKGRPFILEMVEPKKRAADLENIQNEINSASKGMVFVHSLQVCGKEDVVAVKNDEFEKIYSAKCSCENAVAEKDVLGLENKSIEIVQRTPERVEKRRVDKERQKRAKIISAKYLNPNEFQVDILASHGLYVKEFISGDGGRTLPSISGLLGKSCVCKELDVLEIVLK